MVKAVLKANPDILIRFGPRGRKFMSTLLKNPGQCEMTAQAFLDVYRPLMLSSNKV
jgi:hypothetical protein